MPSAFISPAALSAGTRPARPQLTSRLRHTTFLTTKTSLDPPACSRTPPAHTPRMDIPLQTLEVSSLPPAQKPPAAAFTAAVTLGTAKAATPLWKVLALGIVAGAYIALGALLALSIGGACPGISAANPGLAKLIFGAFGLPFGLTMVVTAGGELFTGNTLLVGAAALAGKVSLPSLLLNWTAAFLGNFAGSLLIVRLALVAGTVTGASTATAIGIATAKVGMTFGTAFARGVLCNWLVCLGVYLSNAASDFSSKFLAIFLPISAFVAMGFDHSVANMFLVPMGKVLGAEVGWKAFLIANLLPVTLGNIVGGLGLVAGVYYLCYGRK